MLEVGERDVRERAEEKAKQLQEELGDPIQVHVSSKQLLSCFIEFHLI